MPAPQLLLHTPGSTASAGAEGCPQLILLPRRPCPLLTLPACPGARAVDVSPEPTDEAGSLRRPCQPPRQKTLVAKAQSGPSSNSDSYTYKTWDKFLSEFAPHFPPVK